MRRMIMYNAASRDPVAALWVPMRMPAVPDHVEKAVEQ